MNKTYYSTTATTEIFTPAPEFIFVIPTPCPLPAPVKNVDYESNLALRLRDHLFSASR